MAQIMHLLVIFSFFLALEVTTQCSGVASLKI